MNFRTITALAIAMAFAASCSQGEKAGSETDSPSQNANAGGASVRLYTFDCGRIDISDASIFSNSGDYDGQSHNFMVPCYLIRHPDGDLFYDAGLPDAMNAQEGGVDFPPFHLSVPVTLASQMEAMGITPADIEYFSPSHAHFDHIGNAAMFAGSTIIIDRDEWAYMFSDEMRADENAFPLVAPLEDSKKIEFDGDYDVFGDGSVVILETPGHTPGHTSLLINLANEGPVMLTGDLYHLLEAREKRTVPIFNTSAEDTLTSMDRFEAIAADKNARVIVEHSMEHYQEMPKPPEYLD